MLDRIIKFFLDNRLITLVLLLAMIFWGISVAPFDWETDLIPRDQVPVDAIPDIGENQQIVFTRWAGRSPQDVEDQITYPLTSALLGISGVKSIRSSSMFGFSSIYVIFEDGVDFYWSRSRILEKLNSLPTGVLPEAVQPSLGPDATALGQIFWYTIEGRDSLGNPTGGWDLDELRSVQDFYVKYGLASARGVAEVASIGGFVREYQIDLDPTAMKAYDVSISMVANAIRKSNVDVGARTIELNSAEYFVRGLGYIESIEDIEKSVIHSVDGTPIRIKDIGRVGIGPAERRGILDKSGAEVAGGVVVARYGANPLEVIKNVKAQIDQISPGLPTRTLADGRTSQLEIVPFYDRTHLIHETIGTLEEALTLEVLITILVIIVMVLNLRASFLISGLLPVAVLMSFIAMRYFGVDANIVALSGIAIAIGTMVDVGIVISENIVRHLDEASSEKPRREVIFEASSEVGGAVLTAIATTVISFLPVFTLQAAEGKLFRPLAFTKTFALIASIIVALAIIPTLAHIILGINFKSRRSRIILNGILAASGIYILFIELWAGFTFLAFAASNIMSIFFPERSKLFRNINLAIAAIAVAWLLSAQWMPLGPAAGEIVNFIFVALIIGFVLGVFKIFIEYYSIMLRWALRNKAIFLAIPAFIVVLGLSIWLGFNTLFGFIANGFDSFGINIRKTSPWSAMAHAFPGMSKEFMPSLDEGSFLLMPTSMPHSGIEKNKEILQYLDMAVVAIPEIESVVGKLGRVESALDPAPISMFENVINYKSEYKTDKNGRRTRFAVDENDEFLRDSRGNLVPDGDGEYYRQWRDHIHSPDDIWDEIVRVTRYPGVTSAPKLQPIETRLVMLQTGMRAPIGIKVKGNDLNKIEQFGVKLEKLLIDVPSVKKEAVFADRLVGKPYLQIDINRDNIARYGISVSEVQNVIETAIGGIKLTTTVEGRERYPVRARYAREFRDNPEEIENILVSSPSGVQVPLGHLAEITYTPGPQNIKSENSFLVGYVLLDKRDGYSEMDVVEDARKYLNSKIEEGELIVPAGISYEFAGNYENQVRAEKRLAIVVPLSLLIIFFILYMQFRTASTSLMIIIGVAVAFSGGFLMLWLYGQPWFLDFSLFGENIRNIFNIHTVNLSVAVWVGFLALFGIATDDGVIMATYLKQVFEKNTPDNIEEIRAAVVEAGKKRVRPCLMTTATTILALLPVLTSTGRGSDIMIPMAIPAVGGMSIALITLFVVPVLYSLWHEKHMKIKEIVNK
ncbi:MAG: efflux RND transporter permease subunit [Candidatus Kapaibacterium sp.]